jgi:hypothetical protein
MFPNDALEDSEFAPSSPKVLSCGNYDSEESITRRNHIPNKLDYLHFHSP